jgi:5-formyltetrahydrofolate cyclo-ligase
MNKKIFRKICLERLKRKNQVNRYKLDKIVIEKLEKVLKNSDITVIMLYIPLKIEVNISSLITKLRKEKKTILVPFMEGESFALVKYRLPLKIKKFGVKEPNYSNRYKKKIDLAIVPIIGTDSTLRRVGFGKGFYDRFFEKNHKSINKILFISRKYCVCPEIITDDYDVKGNDYFTPKRSFLQRKLGI